jgi:hypothetical protein
MDAETEDGELPPWEHMTGVQPDSAQGARHDHAWEIQQLLISLAQSPGIW